MKKIIILLFLFIILTNCVNAEELNKDNLEKALQNQRKIFITQLDARDTNIDERIDLRLIDFKQDIHNFYNLFLFKISIIIIVSVSLGLFIGFMLISWVDSIRRKILNRKPIKEEAKPILEDDLHKNAGVLEQISIKKKKGRPKKIIQEIPKPKTLNEFEIKKPKYSSNYIYGDEL